MPHPRLRSYRFALSLLMFSGRRHSHDCPESARAKGLQAPWQPFTQARRPCTCVLDRLAAVSCTSVTCPFCKSAVSCPHVSGAALQQFPCPTCGENLIVLNPEVRPTDEVPVLVRRT